jgi:uncharacterized protein YoxC
MATNPQLQSEQSGQAEPTRRDERHWRITSSGMRPAFAWALAAIGGFIAISATHQDTAVRLFLPVAVMLMYVWISYPRDITVGSALRTTRIVQLADSAYFLGFLWTLWALIDSFVLRHATGAETAFRVFGYALVTTALGMGIRLFLIQFKYGADDQAAEAELRVERSLAAFSARMEEASQSTHALQKGTEALRGGVEQLSDMLKSLDRDFERAHKDTVNAIQSNIVAVVEEIRTALKSPVQEYGRAVRAYTANVNQQSQVLTHTFQECSADIHEQIKAASANVRSVLKNTGDQLAADHILLMRQLNDESSGIVEALRGFAQKFASIDVQLDGMNQVGQSLSELQRSLVALAEIVGPAGQVPMNLYDFGQHLKRDTVAVTDAITSLVTKLNSIAVPREVTISIDEITRSMENLRLATEALLQKANDQRWEKAPQVASDALFKLTASVNNLRNSFNGVDGIERDHVTEKHQKKRFWPF